MDKDAERRPEAVRAAGSPDPGRGGDPAGPLDPSVDPAPRNATPESSDVPEASDDSFPASDPPTWTRTASTAAHARSDRAEEARWDEAAPEIEPPDDSRQG